MSLSMVRFRTKPDAVQQVRTELAQVFAALRAAAPEGVTYTAYQVAADPEFVLLLDLAEDGPNPLLGLPEAIRFRESIAHWAGAATPPRGLTVLGGYGS